MQHEVSSLSVCNVTPMFWQKLCRLETRSRLKFVTNVCKCSHTAIATPTNTTGAILSADPPPVRVSVEFDAWVSAVLQA